ncbi:MAG: 50S ribosomal protein L24 [Candidatus Hadarchaeales archaeon]
MTSAKPRKQRGAVYSSPLHRRGKRLSAQLSPELRKKYGVRSMRARKGDRVMVRKGDFKKMEGNVLEVDAKRGIIQVEGVVVTKADGTQVPRMLRPSNVMIVKLAEDREREKILKRRSKLG